MSTINLELRDFLLLPPGLTNDAGFLVDAPMSQLMMSAATVGITPWSLLPNGQPHVRSVEEFTWRSHMLRANLADLNGSWIKSDSYLVLDPSEKGAVSYFLSLAQADLLLQRVFGYPYTAHVDVCLKVMGQPVTGSRPDLIAYRRPHSPAAAVECKGRTGSFEASLPGVAKAQARRLPAVLNTTGTTVAIASISYFDGDGSWSSLMIDPEPVGDAEGIPYEAVVYAHYWPLVTLVNSMRSDGASSGRTRATEPSAGFTLELPEGIMEIFGSHDAASLGSRLEAGRRMANVAEAEAERLGVSFDDWVDALQIDERFETRLDGCAFRVTARRDAGWTFRGESN